MFFAEQSDSYKIELFISYLNSSKSGTRNFDKTINEILRETQEFCLGKKDIYKLSRENFSVIIYLYDQEPDFFRNLAEGEIPFSKHSELLDKISAKA